MHVELNGTASLLWVWVSLLFWSFSVAKRWKGKKTKPRPFDLDSRFAKDLATSHATCLPMMIDDD